MDGDETGQPDPGGGAGELDAFFDRVDYPLYVITARAPDGEMSGCVAGFVTQCSIEPPNFVVCVSKENHTYGVAERASAMGLHLLGRDQVALVHLFAEETGDRVDKFASAAWRLGEGGAPLLEDVAARLEGRILGHIAVGDHDAFVRRAERAAAGNRPGLLTYRTTPPLEPGHPV